MGTRPHHRAGPAVAARDEEILRAAFEVFIEKGFHGATMLEVAGRARASKSTLYARFENKEALFATLVARRMRQGCRDLEAIADDGSLDPLVALHRFARRLLAEMVAPQRLAILRIAIGDGSRLTDFGKAYSEFSCDHGAVLARRLAGRLIKNRIEIDDLDDFAHAFVGFLQGELFTLALFGAIPSPTDEEIAAQASRAVDRLLRAFSPSRRGKATRRPHAAAAESGALFPPD